MFQQIQRIEWIYTIERICAIEQIQRIEWIHTIERHCSRLETEMIQSCLYGELRMCGVIVNNFDICVVTDFWWNG